MPDITIKMNDGTVREFKPKGRAGGSYTNSMRSEPGFIVIVDEWDSETWIPERDVAEVNVQREHRW